MAISSARVTRLGLSGYMVKPYGSFAGKTPTEQLLWTPVPPVTDVWTGATEDSSIWTPTTPDGTVWS